MRFGFGARHALATGRTARHGASLRALASALAGLALACGVAACNSSPASRGASAASTKPTQHDDPEAAHTGVRSEPVWREAAGLRVLEVTIGDPDGALPMVVFIHGRGDVAHTGWIDGFDAPARYFFPQAKPAYGSGFSWFTFTPLAGMEKLAGDIAEVADQVARAIEELSEMRPTRGKAIVAGFSQGGMLSYALALRHPERIACSVPVAGLLPEAFYAEMPKQGVRYPPIFGLHGRDDSLVPYDAAARMTEVLSGKGMTISLREYPGVDHALTSEMRAEMHARVRQGVESQARAAVR